MRDILFRGKRIDSGEWVYGFYVYIPCGRFGKEEYMIQTVKENGKMGRLHDINCKTVGQYTGLIDKNGKKIFEGDILKWDKKEWGCPFNEIAKWDYSLLNARKTDWKDFCEIIGNIYDNQE